MFSLQTFMKMITVARVPHFSPEPPVFTSEADAVQPETMFEKYVYLRSFHHDDIGLDIFLEFFNNYTQLTPGFEGTLDSACPSPDSNQFINQASTAQLTRESSHNFHLDFTGAADNSDVWPPGATEPFVYPYHYNLTYVHFFPGGYVNGHK